MSSPSVDRLDWQPTIMVVDDHEGVRVTLELVLTRSGYRVLSADSGSCAVMLASTESIDAVLIDVHMPGMTGFECLRLILQNRDPLQNRMPVWFITGAPTPEVNRAALQVGALGVLQKPFELSELVAVLRSGLTVSSHPPPH
ncbi:MAG: response regulator [Opitutus sp.]